MDRKEAGGINGFPLTCAATKGDDPSMDTNTSAVAIDSGRRQRVSDGARAALDLLAFAVVLVVYWLGEPLLAAILGGAP